jgi:hypothetical protein
MEQKNSLDKSEVQNPTSENLQYIPQSDACVSVDTITPSEMRYDMLKAIATIDRRVNGVDEYVAEKLGYIVGNASVEDKKKGIKYLCDAFSSEQVDAIAVAIYNIESKGQGCIIGDQTGIGKGRIAAGIIRYGIHQGLKPIFVTEAPNLFSDFFRDLISIGSDDDIPYKILVGTEWVSKKSIKSEILSSDEDDSDASNQEEEDEESDSIEKPIYEKNKNFPNKFIYKIKDSNDNEITMERNRVNSAVPFIINISDSKSQKKVVIKDANGHILYEADQKVKDMVLGTKKDSDEVIGTDKSGRPKYKKVFVDGTMEVPNGYDFVLVTYSQFRQPESSPISRFLLKIAENNVVVMDESHNASGESTTGLFLQKVLRNTLGVTFLSGTFAKRPNNMPIYASKTSLSDANMSTEDLVQAIKKGGFALQEIVSSALVSEGQMIRRERSFEGIEINYIYLDESQLGGSKSHLDLRVLHTALSDRCTEIIREIIKFKLEHVNPIISKMDREIKSQTPLVKGVKRPSVTNVSAYNGIFDLINMMLFSIKAQVCGEIAVERLKEGKKPIISFAQTLESFLNELKNENGELASEGDIIGTDFTLILEKRLVNSLKYKTITHSPKEETTSYLNIEEQSQEFRVAYSFVKSLIKSSPLGISCSPIDVVANVIKKAGYSVLEVTGRQREVKILNDGKGQIKKRNKISPFDAFLKFNDNEVDVLLINQAGSTGASAHAVPTEKVPKEQVKQRVMIFLQSELNVSTEVQKRGRINRTGQILKPIYDYVISCIPAEKRLSMMLQRKLKSLSANTTSTQKQAEDTSEDEDEFKDRSKVDFLNKYGDIAIKEFLLENMQINALLDDPIDLVKDGQNADPTDASSKVLSKVAILSVADQQKFYSEVVEKYVANIIYLNQRQQNDLKVIPMNLEAETLSKTIAIVGKGKKGAKSVFSKNSMLEKCLINNLKKPYKSSEIKLIIEQSLNGLTSEQQQENLISKYIEFVNYKLTNDVSELEKYFDDLVKNVGKNKSIVKISDEQEKKVATEVKIAEFEEEKSESIQNLNRITENKKNILLRLFRFFTIGKPIAMPTDKSGNEIKGIFLGYSISFEEKNPYAPSNIKLKFAFLSQQKYLSLPASKFDILDGIYSRTSQMYYTDKDTFLERWDSEALKNSADRVQRYIVTGNILQAMGKNEFSTGSLINYTTNNGGFKRGILLPELFSLIDNKSAKIKVPITKALPILLNNLSDGNELNTDSNLTIIFREQYYQKYYEILVPSKELGERYYTDSFLISMSRDARGFSASGSRMSCIIMQENLAQTLEYLETTFGLSVELSASQFLIIEDTIPVEEDEDDEINNQSDKFLEKLDEANRQEEERRKKEEERLAEEEKIRLEQEKQESDNAKMLIEQRKVYVRSKLNVLMNMINNFYPKMSMGGNVKVGQLYTWVNQGVEHNISVSKIDDNNVYYIFDGRNKVDTKSEFDKIIKENNLVAGYNL